MFTSGARGAGSSVLPEVSILREGGVECRQLCGGVSFEVLLANTDRRSAVLRKVPYTVWELVSRSPWSHSRSVFPQPSRIDHIF